MYKPAVMFLLMKCKLQDIPVEDHLVHSCSYYMGGIKLTEEEVEKDLGVWN